MTPSHISQPQNHTNKGNAKIKNKVITKSHIIVKKINLVIGMKIVYCTTKVMLVDFFVKLLQGNLFRKFRTVILGHMCVSSLCNFNFWYR